MQTELQVLIIAAITVSCLHTVAGPDHYLPFIALSKSRSWSFSKTILWTIACGCGHVWSSVLLALVASAIGWSLSSVEGIQGIRGGIAGWALLFFGVVYATWGFWKIKNGRRHKHFEMDDGSLFVFEHDHKQTPMMRERHVVTPWVMFVIFLLGPCEPMIALIYFPAAQHSWYGMFLLITIYTVFTLIAMLVMVTIGYYGLSFLKTETLEKYMHPIGGLTIFICGAGMLFLGW